MDADWVSLLKIWGPLGLGWPIAYMLWRELMTWVKEQRERALTEVESRLKLSASLDALTKIVERSVNEKP